MFSLFDVHFFYEKSIYYGRKKILNKIKQLIIFQINKSYD